MEKAKAWLPLRQRPARIVKFVRSCQVVFKYLVNIEQESCESLHRVVEHGGEVFDHQHLPRTA
jgi:hypothetical protein